MSTPGRNEVRPRRGRRRAILGSVLLAAVATVALVAAIFVPVHSASRLLEVSSAGGSSATLDVPASVWVTLHFDHPGAASMAYSMNGPGGGMMFRHAGMMHSDSYAFWSSGGSFECWAGYAGPMTGTTPVWVNATWGWL